MLHVAAMALGLLAGDVTILESGSVENRAGYRAGHLAADVAYAAAVPSVRTPPTGPRAHGVADEA